MNEWMLWFELIHLNECRYSVYHTKNWGNKTESHGIKSEESIRGKQMVILITWKDRILVSKPRYIIEQWWTDSWQESKRCSGELKVLLDMYS